jgi:hypothetical protein
MGNQDEQEFGMWFGDALAECIATYFNQLLKVDKPAVAAMFANRVPCNKAMADHPTVQVTAQHGGYHVGLIGILNGLCGVRDDGMGRLCLVWKEVDAGEEPELVGLALTPKVAVPAPCDVPIAVSKETEEDAVGVDAIGQALMSEQNRVFTLPVVSGDIQYVTDPPRLRPMSTAPRDGSWVLVFWADGEGRPLHCDALRFRKATNRVYPSAWVNRHSLAVFTDGNPEMLGWLSQPTIDQ